MKQKDKRYQKTEEKINQTIQRAIGKNPKTICLRPSSLICCAKISPSTFYRHHKNLDSVIRYNEKRVFKKFHRHFHSIQKIHPNLKFNISLFLKFIYDNGDYFFNIFARQNSEIIFKMFELLKPQIYQIYNIPSNTPKTFRMLYFEVYSLLEYWQKNNFNITEMDNIQKDIFALLDTITKRIPPSEQN